MKKALVLLIITLITVSIVNAGPGRTCWGAKKHKQYKHKRGKIVNHYKRNKSNYRTYSCYMFQEYKIRLHIFKYNLKT